MGTLNLHKFSITGLSSAVAVNSIKRATYDIQMTLSALYIKFKESASIDNSCNVPPYESLHMILHLIEIQVLRAI